MDKPTLAKAILCALIQAYPDADKVNGHYIPDTEYVGICQEAIDIASVMENQLYLDGRLPKDAPGSDFSEENSFVDGLD